MADVVPPPNERTGVSAGGSIAPPAVGSNRCAPRHRATGADPVGSAGHYDAFVVVECPLPWDRDATGCRPFRELGWTGPCHTGADGRSWRPMVVVPDPANRTDDTPDTGSRRGSGTGVGVTVWERPVGTVGPYRGRRWVADDTQVPGLIDALVGGSVHDELFPPSVPPVRPAPPTLLVCTHGRRDVCCGSLGVGLISSLDLPAGSGIEVRRCSHTGGHRFAPTALTFPDGMAWAHLDDDLVRELVRRDAPPSAALVAAGRGAAQLATGPEQAADRAAWARFGWDWFGGDRRVEPQGAPPNRVGDPPVRVDVDGALGSGWVLVEVAAEVAMPPCGAPEDDGGVAAETERLWRVVQEHWSAG